MDAPALVPATKIGVIAAAGAAGVGEDEDALLVVHESRGFCEIRRCRTAPTLVSERWSGTWDDNLALARLADAAGLDFLLPVARWVGFGGAINFNDGVLDPVTLAAGLLAETSRITVFATIHTAFFHPLAVAKQMATVDQIGHGRAALNVVAGWNEPEYEAFGMELPRSHDDRYALAQEWLDIVRRAWSEESKFDHDGRYFRLRGIESMPKPYSGRVPIINAGASQQGRDFAARNASYLFTPFADPSTDGAQVVARTSREARQRYGRDIGVIALAYVVCRPTRQEAVDYHRHYAEEHADWDAVDNMMVLQGLHAQSFTKEMLATFRGRFAGGGGGYPVIGSPDDVADEIAKIARAGFAGMTLCCVNYLADLPLFVQEVLPRLEQRGIRASHAL